MFDLITAISHVEKAAERLTAACFHHSMAVDAATMKRPTADILHHSFEPPMLDPTDMLDKLRKIK